MTQITKFSEDAMDQYLERALQLMEGATRGMTAAEMGRRPGEGKWSPAEIVEHLERAFSSTVRLLEKHLASGQPARSRPTWTHWWRRATVIEAGKFPSGRPAPEFTLPKGVAPEEAMPRFRRALAAMDDTITRCEQKFGGTRIASHVIFGPLTPRQWRRFHWVHTRHHAKQIEQLRTSGIRKSAELPHSSQQKA